MEPKTLSILIGGKVFAIKEFTLDTLEQLQEPVFSEPKTPKENTTRHISIIATALAQDHPDVTVESVRAMRLGTIKAAADVVMKILEFGGWRTVTDGEAANASQEGVPGEDQARVA